MKRVIFVKLIIYLIINLLGIFLYAQSTITGVISDTIGKPIALSNVFLKQKETQSIIAFAYTSDKGIYTLQTEEVGSFSLSFSALGYETKDINIDLLAKTLITRDVILSRTSYELDEVIITSEKAISERKDTIVFNASFFKQGEESVVQDLLRKLPGVDVSETGIIKVDGREVEKVMVEGDDFFRKGYKVLTKNLDVNAVDKVEVLRRYSNNKLLKGIESSEKVAINLKLDENFKRQWFGSFSPGYGVVSENRYDVDATISSFGKNNKYFLLSSLNNIGEDATDDIRGLIDPNSNEIGVIGEDQRAYSFMNLSQQVPLLKMERANFNNEELVSLNSIFKLSSKINLKVLGLFNSDDNKFFREGFDSFFANATSFTNTENYALDKNINVGFGRVEIDYDISENELFEYEGKYIKSSTNTNSELVFNGLINNEFLVRSNDLLDHMIKYTNKFKGNKVLLLTARYINQKKPEEYKTNQFLFDDIFPSIPSTDNLQQFSENKLSYAGFKAHLLDRKKNKDLLDFSLGYEFREDKFISDLFLKEGEVTLLNPEAYKNTTAYTTNDLFFSSGYRKKIKNTAIKIELEGHQLFNKLSGNIQIRDESPFLINTGLNFKWEVTKRSKILAFINNASSNANISDIYSNYILSGYRNFSRGTGEFNQLRSTQAYASYNLGNFGDRFIVNASFLYGKDNDFLSTNSIITQEFIQATQIIIPDREFYNADIKIDRYLRFIKNNIKINFSYTLSEFKNIVNNTTLRSVESADFAYGFELRSGFRGIFNYHLGSTWKSSKVTTDIVNNANRNISFLDLSLVFSSRFNIQLNSERYFFGNLENSDKSYYFMDLEINYKPKNTDLSFSLMGNNLLNTNVFRNYSVSDTYISNTEYKLLPRYLLLKVNFKF